MLPPPPERNGTFRTVDPRSTPKSESRTVDLCNVSVVHIIMILIEFFTNTQSCHIFVVFLFASSDLIKCKIRYQGVHEDYISRLLTLQYYLISNGTAKRKLAILTQLYWEELVKNSNGSQDV